MSRLSNLVIHIIQIFGTLLGFSYVYFNFEGRQVKFYTILKIYVYLINITYTGVVYFIIDFIFNLSFNEEYLENFMVITFYISGAYVMCHLILLRIKEERVIKKWIVIFLPLQTIYFDKILYITNVKNTTTIPRFTYLIVFGHSIYNLYIVFTNLIPEVDIIGAVESSLPIFLIGLQHYILLHHGFILYYINNCFSKLNCLLDHGQVHEPLANIYLKLSSLLHEINNIYGSIIMIILFSQVISISLQFYGLVELFYVNIYLSTNHLLELIVNTLLLVNVFLYYVICNQLCDTTKDTGQILKQYSTRDQNQEVLVNYFIMIVMILNISFYLQVEMIYLHRFIWMPNISVYGLFSIDLASSFTLIEHIILFSIILIQMDYNKLMKYSDK